MIIYFQDTRGDKLTLNINNITIANWYADADFAEHTDMKRHTGGVLTMDKGAISKIIEAEDQYRKFYRIRIGSREWCVISFVMD